MSGFRLVRFSPKFPNYISHEDEQCAERNGTRFRHRLDMNGPAFKPLRPAGAEIANKESPCTVQVETLERVEKGIARTRG